MNNLSKEEMRINAGRYLEELKEIQPAVETIDNFINKNMYLGDAKGVIAWLDVRRHLKINGPVEINL